LWDAERHALAVEDPIAVVLDRLRDGDVVAIKALGGFQLACDARNAAAVARLRERKAPRRSRSPSWSPMQPHAPPWRK